MRLNLEVWLLLPVTDRNLITTQSLSTSCIKIEDIFLKNKLVNVDDSLMRPVICSASTHSQGVLTNKVYKNNVAVIWSLIQSM